MKTFIIITILRTVSGRCLDQINKFKFEILQLLMVNSKNKSDSNFKTWDIGCSEPALSEPIQIYSAKGISSNISC